MTLAELHIGESAIITGVGGEGALRQHFLDMGVLPGVTATLVQYAPMGDPMELRIHGYELTLRKADAARIQVSSPVAAVHDEHASADEETGDADHGYQHKTEHPGYGEDGRYHEEQKDHKDINYGTVHIALVGNQNSGKTTLFNQLTGSNQHVGNFPGVTIDRKDGHIKGHPDAIVTDLPGIYSLSPYTNEEVISRQFIEFIVQFVENIET